MSNVVKVALHGVNGHQIQSRFPGCPGAELVGLSAFPDERVPAALAGVPRFASLPELLAGSDAELVVLCSPRRAEQAGEAIACLEAGRHVYAEKPSALVETDLDAICAAADRSGRRYCEMGGVYGQQPYQEMRRLVQAGAIGEVVQVFSQKCYPWFDQRPADEAIDGGLLLQVGVYNARFVEHVAGRRIRAIQAVETRLGNPQPASECRMAVSMTMQLDNGGVASALANYLNPIQSRCWGYEILRLFGTAGIVESCADGGQARLLRRGQEPEALDLAAPNQDQFRLLIGNLLGQNELPMTMGDELAPTRWVIRARQASRQA